MRMTNVEIMAQYRKENNIPESVELYTPQAWHNQGYQVKKGSVCKHRVKMCCDIQRGKRKAFSKWYSLFTREQVEPIK